MITLLSPSKKLNFNEQNIVHSHTECDFIESAKILASEAKNLTEDDLKELMHISDNLAQLNRERFDRWSLPFSPSNAKQAILAFDGGVYSGLKAEEFKEKDFSFAQDHLRILSGLYGILKPLDLIQPYRLEMGVSFKNKRGKNLYEFWKEDLTQNLNHTLRKHSNPTIVNCASIEYFSAINLDKFDGKILSVVFKEYRNNELRFISFNAKKARGLMTQYIMKNKIDNNNDIKDFNYENYSFDSKLSDESMFVFTR
ncbi:MAG TPA: peroxide stress protein YaaA [Candidatus Marinimicrobia bacterium]|nr:peroxide stress protein YaaA [Candidatus Neomarinimicrobiota bacterium]|tara:strand:+ start:933 stop:1697 length:765 start_codon:yes stop_codon:yes gene_type:complete